MCGGSLETPRGVQPRAYAQRQAQWTTLRLLCAEVAVESGHVARRTDGVLIWSGDQLAVIQEQYIEFRSALVGEEFS